MARLTSGRSEPARNPKIPLHRELPDLAVKLPDLLVVAALTGPGLEHPASPVEQMPLPRGDLIRMKIKPGRELRQGSILTERRQSDLRLELRRMIPALAFRHYCSFQPTRLILAAKPTQTAVQKTGSTLLTRGGPTNGGPVISLEAMSTWVLSF